jgi:hypothetical protein
MTSGGLTSFLGSLLANDIRWPLEEAAKARMLTGKRAADPPQNSGEGRQPPLERLARILANRTLTPAAPTTPPRISSVSERAGSSDER